MHFSMWIRHKFGSCISSHACIEAVRAFIGETTGRRRRRRKILSKCNPCDCRAFPCIQAKIMAGSRFSSTTLVFVDLSYGLYEFPCASCVEKFIIFVSVNVFVQNLFISLKKKSIHGVWSKTQRGMHVSLSNFKTKNEYKIEGIDKDSLAN